MAMYRAPLQKRFLGWKVTMMRQQSSSSLVVLLIIFLVHLFQLQHPTLTGDC